MKLNGQDEAEGGLQHDSSPDGTPRWVKVFATLGVIVVLIFLVTMCAGGRGAHGPQRHASVEAASIRVSTNMSAERLTWLSGSH